MGLFSKAQIDQINNIAKKTKSVQAPKSSKKVSSINDELIQTSAKVEEYFKDSPAILITNKQQLHEYVTAAIDVGFVGIDTETTGLDRNNDYIVGASLYYPGGVECYIPFKHRIPIFEDEYKDQLKYEDFAFELQRFVDSNSKLIFANANFDLYMIWKDIKIDLCPVCYYDVILAWRCLKENELHNGLKELYNKYVLKGKGDSKRFSDFFSPALFPYCKPEIAKLYAANDAKITYELFLWQLPYTLKSNKKCKINHLENLSDLIWQVEFPLISIIQDIERTGMYIDQDRAKRLQVKYHNLHDKELAELKEMVQKVIDNSDISKTAKVPFTSGENFNPRSPMHVKYLCYDLLQLPKPQGKESTGVEILKDFNLEITDKIVEVRSLATNISTFVDKLPEAVSYDGKIHADFKQVGAGCVTGDTIVATDSGYALISDICKSAENNPGEFVELQNINIINKYQEVEPAAYAVMYQNFETVKVTCEFGITLEGTLDHPVMVSKYTNKDRTNELMYYYKGEYPRLSKLWEGRQFKPLKDLAINDLIEIPCNYSNNAEYQSTNLQLYETKYPWINKDAKVPEVYDENFAEFLGMYHADGNSCVREGTYTIALSNDDPDVYTRFDELSYILFGVNTSRYDKQEDNNEVETYINCLKLRNLEQSVLHTGTRNKRIPEAIWKSPTSVINSYIRGMTLDSTVYIDENGRAAFQLSIINQTDTKLVQMHLISQGIWSHISKNVKDVDDMFLNLTFNADNYMLFRDKIGFIESKKYKDTKPCGKNKYNHRRVGNSFYVKVKSVEKSQNDVYDLNVPKTHSFVSNCMISHNTGRMSSSNPNLMNIPAKLDDIRKMFRATPAEYLEQDCEEFEITLKAKLSRFDQVKIDNEQFISVDRLNIGDKIYINDGTSLQLKEIIDIIQNGNDFVITLSKYKLRGECI